MITHRIIRIAMALTLAAFTHALAAEENIQATPAEDAIRLKLDVPPAEPETLAVEMEKELPPESADKPADALLSNLKIYPSF